MLPQDAFIKPWSSTERYHYCYETSEQPTLLTVEKGSAFLRLNSISTLQQNLALIYLSNRERAYSESKTNYTS